MQFRLSENAFLVNYSPLNREKDMIDHRLPEKIFEIELKDRKEMDFCQKIP